MKIQLKEPHGAVPKPVILLLQPQLAENLGAVARAMANFGLEELRLIDPLCLPHDNKAIATAAGADFLLDACKMYPSFEEAIADLALVYGTCATTRHMIKPILPLRGVAETIQKVPHRIGVIFGPERTGLTNDHLARCHGVIQIPTNPGFSSLNLAQAVLCVGYELFQTQATLKPELHTGETTLATQREVQEWLQFLETTLDQAHFWRVPSKKPIMWRNMMNIFTRMHLTSQEIRTLFGMVECLQKPRIPKKSL